MKKAVIGGFLSLVGSIWALVVVTIASQDLVSGWPNPPGRFLTTVLERDLMPVFATGVALTVLGVALLVVAFFQKD